MKRRSLTKRMIDAKKSNPRKEVRLWDADVVGLFLRIRGESRSWWFQYSRGGRETHGRVKVGDYGSITLKQAREEAKKLIGVVKEKRDPVKERRAKLDTIPRTIEDLATAYLAYGLISKGKNKGKKKKPRTVAEDRGLLGLPKPAPPRKKDKDGKEVPTRVEKLRAKEKRRKRTILEVLGKKLVNEVHADDIVRLQDGWRDTPIRANRALALLSSMFTFAIPRGYRTDRENPVAGVDRFDEEPRKHRSDGKDVYLSGKEFAALSKALVEIEAEGHVTPFAIAAIRLLAFTGARASEILGLKWEQVHLAEGKAKLPDSKTGAKDLLLPPAARTVISKLKRIEGNDHVIPGRIEGEPLTLWGLEQAWSVVRKRAGLETTRLHDLRHSFASTAIASGASLMLVARLLGHADTRTTERYAHLTDDVLQTAAAATGASIAKSMSPKRAKAAKGTNVTPFRRRTA